MASRMAERAALSIDFSKRIDILHRISRAVVQAKAESLPEILDLTYGGVEELFSVEVNSAVFLLSIHSTPKLEYIPGKQVDRTSVWGKIPLIPIGKGVVGRTVQTRQRVHIRSVSQEAPSMTDYIPHIRSTQTSIGFPLLTPEGVVLGAFLVESETPDSFDDLDVEILDLFAQFTAIALSNHKFLAALDEAKQQAISQAGLTALGEITGNLVHRISNDIGSAHLDIREALKHNSLAPSVRRELQRARKSCKDVLRLVGNILERIGEIGTSSKENIDLELEVQEAIKSLVGVPATVEITPKIPRKIENVQSTPSLALVIGELLRNALKSFGKPHKGMILITAASQGQHVLLSVLNNGRPIPPKSQSEIFKFLYQGENAGRRTGIGFGLYWARAVLRGHGGEILLAFSDEKRGTQFDIKLKKFGKVDTMSTSILNDTWVVMIDPDKRWLRLSSEYLSRLGYRLRCFPDIDSACGATAINGETIVVASYRSFRSEGLSLSRIRSANGAKAKVILLLDVKRPSMIRDCFRAGAYDCVVKPSDCAELATILAASTQ